MIPSKYLFPVIALVLIWVISLWSVYHISNKPVVDEDARQQQLMVYDNLINAFEGLNESNVFRFRNKLRTEGSGQFDPIHPVLDQNDEIIRKLQERIAEVKEEMKDKVFHAKTANAYLTDIVNLSEATATETTENNHTLLTKFAEQFHMSPEGAEKHTELSIEAKNSLDLQHYKNTLPQDLHSFNQQLALLELTILQFNCRQQNDLISLSDGFTIMCHFGPNYYPLPFHSTFQQGQDAPVGFRLWQVPERSIYNVSIVLNGDTITPSSNGFFELPLDVSRRGHQSENITLIETNPLTGISSSWDFEQSYYVTPK